MAHNPQLANASAYKAADAVTPDLNGGYLRIYSGSQPANANTPASGTLLVQLGFGSPAYAVSVNGVAAPHTISAAAAIATGTATWFRTVKSDGTTAVFDGTVGNVGSGSDLELSIGDDPGAPVNIVVGLTVAVSSLAH